jgi:UDP-N-acetylmuramate dehydrogenase
MKMSSASRMPTPIHQLRTAFGSLLQENVIMANYTTAHVGGPADAVVIAQSLEELEQTTLRLWQLNQPFYLLGSGSNVLVSDAGIRGVVVINRAHNVKIDTHIEPPQVWAESGANLSVVARQAALRGLSGLEWAAHIPGSVGGAVYGNAGAYESDVQKNLILAEILHRTEGRKSLSCTQMAYSYRSSILKRDPGKAIILAARIGLRTSTKEDVHTTMEKFNAHRRRTQPPGASLGSIFKNPTGDHAGRLIDAAGLKGTRAGGAIISQMHANFIINDQQATAKDFADLISLSRQTVQNKNGVRLSLEVELLGDWAETEYRELID